MKKLSLRKKLLFSTIVLVASLAALEGLLRLAGYRPAPRAAREATAPGEPVPPEAFGYFIICDQHLGFRNRAHGVYRAHLFPGKPLSTTDQFGYRNGFGWTAKGIAPIVLFVGDSFTFCSEVNDDETGPAEVAKQLRKEFDVRVLNAGVRGYSALQVKRMLAECLTRFPQIILAVYTHCGNDMEESLLSTMHYPAKGPAVVRDAASGRFREVEVTHPTVPWGKDFLAWRPAVVEPSRAAELSAWLHGRSVLWHHGQIGLDRFLARWPAPPEHHDGDPSDLPADPAAWHRWAQQHDGNAVMQWLLSEMQQMCQSHGASLLVTSAYTGLDRETPAECAADCAAAGVPYLSLVEHFPEPPEVYQAQRCDGRPDPHYSAAGTKTYAAAVAPALAAMLRNVSGTLRVPSTPDSPDRKGTHP